MIHFRWITHLDTFAVIARLHKVEQSKWRAEPTEAGGEPGRLFLILRHHAKAGPDNWLEDLPLHDSEDMQKWTSLNRLLLQARKAIFADPALQRVLDASAPPGRVMLSSMAKQTALSWHADGGPYHERHLRFHVPLLTNPLCSAFVQNEQVHMEVGSLWWVNYHAQHTLTNFGLHRRVHLIFELPKIAKAEDDADV